MVGFGEGGGGGGGAVEFGFCGGSDVVVGVADLLVVVGIENLLLVAITN